VGWREINAYELKIELSTQYCFNNICSQITKLAKISVKIEDDTQRKAQFWADFVDA